MQRPQFILLLCLLSISSSAFANGPIQLITVENLVEIRTDGGKQWKTANTGDALEYGHRVRTGEFSRAALQYPSGNVIRLGEFSRITLAESKKTDPNKAKKPLAIELKEGALYFFSRKKEDESDVVTPTVNAAIRGTEFEIRVLPDQSTELYLFEGEVELSNSAGQLSLTSGESALTKPNAAPKRLPVIEASSYMQWYLYYPGVLDIRDLELGSSYQDSASAYTNGNLLKALESLPKTKAASNHNDAKLYEAAVILASGQVEAATQRLNGLQHPEAAALEELIGAIKGEPIAAKDQPNSATGWLARSYTRQAKGDLRGARHATDQALNLYPKFGYAAARLARMEFGFGEFHKMEQALELATIFQQRKPGSVCASRI